MFTQEELQTKFEELLNSGQIEYLEDFVDSGSVSKNDYGEYISITTHLAFKMFEAGYLLQQANQQN